MRAFKDSTYCVHTENRMSSPCPFSRGRTLLLSSWNTRAVWTLQQAVEFPAAWELASPGEEVLLAVAFSLSLRIWQ